MEVSLLIALLGRRDIPTDGVEDYCTYLGHALARRGVKLEMERVSWVGTGWPHALRKLWRQSAGWRGDWVVVQYTALAWSRRGFPFAVLVVLAILRHRGVRCAVLFHESRRQWAGTRLRDRIRGVCQDWVVRQAYRIAEKTIFTIPLAKVVWLHSNDNKAESIPIGANIPERFSEEQHAAKCSDGIRTVAVFCLSQNANRVMEIADLIRAAERARDSFGSVRFTILGKGSMESRPLIERALRQIDVNVRVLGLLPADDVSETLSSATVLLYLCGQVFQTRGSVLAGIATGLPIIGYGGRVSETPLEEAGLELVPYRDREALAAALVRVLKNTALQAELRKRSWAAQRRHFSWDAIARRYVDFFELGTDT